MATALVFSRLDRAYPRTGGPFSETLAGGSTNQHGFQALVAVGAVWLLTYVNVRGVREAGVVQLVTTVGHADRHGGVRAERRHS